MLVRDLLGREGMGLPGRGRIGHSPRSTRASCWRRSCGVILPRTGLAPCRYAKRHFRKSPPCPSSAPPYPPLFRNRTQATKTPNSCRPSPWQSPRTTRCPDHRQVDRSTSLCWRLHRSTGLTTVRILSGSTRKAIALLGRRIGENLTCAQWKPIPFLLHLRLHAQKVWASIVQL